MFSCTIVCIDDVRLPRGVLVRRRQLAAQEQPRHLEEALALGELFDRVAAIAQDALVAVDERDGAAAVRRVHERRVVGHQTEVVGGRLDLAQLHAGDRAVLDGDLVLLAGAVVDDGERVAGHESSGVGSKPRMKRRAGTGAGDAGPRAARGGQAEVSAGRRCRRTLISRHHRRGQDRAGRGRGRSQPSGGLARAAVRLRRPSSTILRALASYRMRLPVRSASRARQHATACE